MSNLFSKVALGLSLTCVLAMADGAFIGVEGDYSFQSKLKSKFVEDPEQTDKKGQFGLGLKAGYDFDIARIYGAYVYDFQAKKASTDGEGHPYTAKWKTHKFIVGADYTPTISENFKLVLGGYTGYSKIKLQSISGDESKKASANGWLIEAKIGGEYSLNANNAVEFGVKADRTDYGKIGKWDVTDIKETNAGLYLGYTYKF